MKICIAFIITVLSIVCPSVAWASSAGAPCPALNAVERDGGQTLICDGAVWRLSTIIQPSGTVLYGNGNGSGNDHTLFFHHGNESGVPTGDGFRFRKTNIPTDSFNDYYVFEKTDGNDTSPDGGFLFAGTGMDGVVKPWILMNRNGFGIKSDVAHSALYVPNGQYAQFAQETAGAPPANDCNGDDFRGRLSIDTTNNRLYVCNGAARGWDYIALTD